MKQTLNITASDFAKGILMLRGKPLSLEDYIPFKEVYDMDPPMMIIKAGRQIGKSVSLGGAIISKSIVRPHFNSLYIAPLSQQTSRFSTSYLDPFMYSPLVRKHFVDSSSKKNVFEKSFNNGSRIFLGYAQTENDSDRVRGANADACTCDEIQDISQEALPILFETLSASPYGYKRLTGTAKTENNTLEIYFKKSNMLEWVVKCDHCAKYTIPHDFESCLKIVANKEGPGCVYCGKVIDMRKGKWVALKPSEKDILGFHMPQFIMPARTKPKHWKDIQDKIPMYSPGKLANEVFGLASGIGGRILSMSEARACCNPEKKAYDDCWPTDWRGINQVVVGVDWSVTGSDKSYTVITVLGSDFNGKLHLMYAERITEPDLLGQVARVGYIYEKFNAQMIGADRGVGHVQGELLRQKYGHERVLSINYVSAKTRLRWDPAGYMAADRTTMMDVLFMRMKMGRDHFEAPSWSVSSEFWFDCLAIFEEETLAGKKVFRKNEDDTDDSFHSATFALCALFYLRGDYTYLRDNND